MEAVPIVVLIVVIFGILVLIGAWVAYRQTGQLKQIARRSLLYLSLMILTAAFWTGLFLIFR